MPFVGPTESSFDLVRIFQDEKYQYQPEYTRSEITAAAFRTWNWQVNLQEAMFSSPEEGGYPDTLIPGWNFWKEDPEAEMFLPWHDNFSGVSSQAQANRIKEKIRRETKDAYILENGGAFGLFSQFGAAILDPLILLPGSWLFKGGALAARGASVTAKAQRLAAISRKTSMSHIGAQMLRSGGRIGLTTAALETPTQVLLHQLRETRTTPETMTYIVSAGVMGGLLGAAGRGVKITNRYMRHRSLLNNRLTKHVFSDEGDLPSPDKVSEATGVTFSGKKLDPDEGLSPLDPAGTGKTGTNVSETKSKWHVIGGGVHRGESGGQWWVIRKIKWEETSKRGKTLKKNGFGLYKISDDLTETEVSRHRLLKDAKKDPKILAARDETIEPTPWFKRFKTEKSAIAKLNALRKEGYYGLEVAGRKKEGWFIRQTEAEIPTTAAEELLTQRLNALNRLKGTIKTSIAKIGGRWDTSSNTFILKKPGTLIGGLESAETQFQRLSKEFSTTTDKINKAQIDLHKAILARESTETNMLEHMLRHWEDLTPEGESVPHVIRWLKRITDEDQLPTGEVAKGAETAREGLRKLIREDPDVGKKWQALMQGKSNPEDMAEIKSNPVSNFLIKTLSRFNPGMRLTSHPIAAVRILHNQLEPAAFWLKDAWEGVAQRTSVYTRSLLTLRSSYMTIKESKLIYSNYAKSTENPISQAAFWESISDALITKGDVHAIPAVQKAAALFREFIDEVTKRGQDVGALPKVLDLSGAQNYFMRYFNLEKLFMKGEKEKFIDSVAKGLAEKDPKITGALKKAEDYYNEIVSLEVNSTDTSALAGFPKAGSLQKRVMEIDDIHLQPWLERDARKRLIRFAKSVGPDIEMHAEFGSHNGSKAIANIEKHLKKWVDEESDPIKRRAREKVQNNAIRDLKHTILEIRNKARVPSDPTSLKTRTLRALRQSTYLRTGGSILFSSIMDAAYPVMRYGLTGPFRAAFSPFVDGIKHVKLAKMESELFLEGTELIGNSYSRSVTNMEMDGYIPGVIEKGLEEGVRLMHMANLTTVWNHSARILSGLMSQHHILTSCENLVNGTIKGMDIARLAQVGIDEKWARRIVKQDKIYGAKGKSLRISNVLEWRDPKAVAKLREGVSRSGHQTVMLPGPGDRSIWMSTELGQVVSQYMSFGMTATSRLLIMGFQQGDMAVLNTWLASTGLAALGYTAREYVRNPLGATEKLSNMPLSQWALESVDRSGMTGILFDFDRLLQTFSDDTVGVSAWSDRYFKSRYYGSTHVLDAIAGPSGSTLQNMTKVSGGVFREIFDQAGMESPGWTGANTRQLRKMLPYNNLFWLSALFSKLMSGEQDQRQRQPPTLTTAY